MNQHSDTEKKLTRWSVIIVSAGLLLTFMQLVAQIAIGLGWTKKPSGDLGSFYIGVVVLLIGVALMAVISLSARRDSITQASDSSDQSSGI